MDYQIRKRSK